MSQAGGTEAVWARSGKELFYRRGRALMSVAVQTSPTFAPGTPVRLFEGDYETGHRFQQNYDVSLDGSRFLMLVREGAGPRVPVHIEMDLQGELRRLTPPGR